VAFLYCYSDMFNFQKIGSGNFSVVFKVLNMRDGCLYAVQSIKQLNDDMER
jgi:hypothetical protein